MTGFLGRLTSRFFAGPPAGLQSVLAITVHPADDLIYRLKHWPQLPGKSKTADIYRILSMMSTRPVNRRWMLTHTSLREQDVELLLRRLIEQGAVEVIDPAQFALTASRS